MNIKVIAAALLGFAAISGCGPMPPMDPDTRAALLGYYVNKQYNRRPIYRPEDFQYQPIGPKVRCRYDGFETTCY